MNFFWILTSQMQAGYGKHNIDFHVPYGDKCSVESQIPAYLFLNVLSIEIHALATIAMCEKN